MPRLPGVQPRDAGWLVRLAYWIMRRRYGKVLPSAQITALNPKLLRAVAGMETGQKALRAIDPVVMSLAEIKAAMMIGCPF